MFRGGRGQRGGAVRGGRGGFQQRGGRGGPNDRFDNRNNRGGRGGRRFGYRDYDKPQRIRDASVQIQPDWKMIEEIDFARLAKLNLETDDGEDLDNYGFLYYYDRTYDKAPPKGTERRLAVSEKAYFNPTTSDDPIIQELADKDEATIFATESILAMLMCAPRSINSWDIVITRRGNKVFLDKRDTSGLEYVTVNENAIDPPMEPTDGKESINSPNALAFEASYINLNFAHQVVVENEDRKFNFDNENPFYNPQDGEPLASKGYKYRRFDLSTTEEDPVHLIVRTEVDAVLKNPINGSDMFVTCKALNEFDDRAQGAGGAPNWRDKLASQRGAVIATEMKNNSCKLAKWTTQAILAKVDLMKLGYVFTIPMLTFVY